MTDKKTEALKLALEALEFYDQQGIGRTPGDKAITAIREALAEQPAQQQEPVGIIGSAATHWYDGIPPVGSKLYTSPPASKLWVVLTKEEILEINDTVREQQGWLAFVRAIEAKLKEKNQ